MGDTYVSRNIGVHGALFFVKLAHFEGELNVGLARRTFDSGSDSEQNRKYAVEWFERKKQKGCILGQEAGLYRLAVVEYDARRKPIYSTSVEPIRDFLPVEVHVTNRTRKGVSAMNEPSRTVSVTRLHGCLESICEGWTVF